MHSRRLSLLFFLSALLCSSLSAIEVATSDWETLKSILATLKTDNGKLAQLLTESKADLTQAQKDLIESQSQLTLAQKELTTLRQSLSEMESSLTKLSESLENIKTGTWWKVGLATSAGLFIGLLISPR